MSYTCDYDKDAPVNVAKLKLEILAESGITTAYEGAKYNTDETPTNLHIRFESEPSSGEKTLLQGIVTNHDGNPPTVYEYFCYSCGKDREEGALSKPTQCYVCSSTDIQDQYHKDNLIATSDPTSDDDDTEGYCVGSNWINTSTGDMFMCVDSSTGAAVWNELDIVTPE